MHMIEDADSKSKPFMQKGYVTQVLNELIPPATALKMHFWQICFVYYSDCRVDSLVFLARCSFLIQHIFNSQVQGHLKVSHISMMVEYSTAYASAELVLIQLNQLVALNLRR